MIKGIRAAWGRCRTLPVPTRAAPAGGIGAACLRAIPGTAPQQKRALRPLCKTVLLNRLL